MAIGEAAPNLFENVNGNVPMATNNRTGGIALMSFRACPVGEPHGVFVVRLPCCWPVARGEAVGQRGSDRTGKEKPSGK